MKLFEKTKIEVVNLERLPFRRQIEEDFIFEGDALQVLRKIPDETYQCCVTSPPYWGIRDYGVGGQIGAEGDLLNFIENLANVFDEVKRVLKNDGVLWLNLGDSYTSGNRRRRAPDKKNPGREMTYRPATPKGLKPKDLIGVPWKIAFALQERGWYLRTDIIWNKPNCQPESVRDRPTRSHEYIFMLTKSEKYLYNYELLKEYGKNGKLRNRRTVWDVNTESFKGAHFAAFPTSLIEPMIEGTSLPESIILDPFFGAGTTGLVCRKLDRRFHGIELNPDYIKLAQERLS